LQRLDLLLKFLIAALQLLGHVWVGFFLAFVAVPRPRNVHLVLECVERFLVLVVLVVLVHGAEHLSEEVHRLFDRLAMNEFLVLDAGDLCVHFLIFGI
jgi:hypothetical protein